METCKKCGSYLSAVTWECVVGKHCKETAMAKFDRTKAILQRESDKLCMGLAKLMMDGQISYEKYKESVATIEENLEAAIKEALPDGMKMLKCYPGGAVVKD